MHTIASFRIKLDIWFWWCESMKTYFYSWDFLRVKKRKLTFQWWNIIWKHIKRYIADQCVCVSFHFKDQTPTPTRFLKNCEEVGLFSDLDCSIEQEFCKAQEEEDSKQVQAGEGNRAYSKKKNGYRFKPKLLQCLWLRCGAWSCFISSSSQPPGHTSRCHTCS